MKDHLQNLKSRRIELLQRIARIDELIMGEIESVLSGNEPNPSQRSDLVFEDSTSRPSKLKDNALKGASVETAKRIRKPNNPASSWPANVRTWSEKILHILNNADDQGMATSEIVKALKTTEGEEGKPIVPATINALLQAMESKTKTIRVERGPTGRKVHFAIGRLENHNDKINTPAVPGN